ncbi:B-box zinc finger protein 20 [Abrus precatorius]|uniref:B-box zinc finger protein 20 n=1 Tax=Abrus precatorius TaxID=3816 RepID=A0A8B8LNN4_ABRPR|nr:B-box zinc finger protein 20 [Abrus precatorius]
MKIQCDVCEKVEATVFCPADEAALCHSCDRIIHHANKLATKHARFSLHYPTSKDFPLCDICQERRAYLFCQEDRALLCRECDLPIHRANEHTQKHNRFLLTGVKLSGTSLDPASSSNNCPEARNPSSKMNRPRSVSNENASSSCKVEDNVASDTGSVSTSSISEYLIETIPGYCFEDLLDASFAPNGFCKNYYDNRSAFQDQDLEVSTCLFPLATWVPQAQVQSPQLSTPSITQIGVREIPRANTVKWRHYGCTVPETSQQLIKRSRISR